MIKIYIRFPPTDITSKYEEKTKTVRSISVWTHLMNSAGRRRRRERLCRTVTGSVTFNIFFEREESVIDTRERRFLMRRLGVSQY